MNSISIGPRFFQIEKRNYANWYSALIRELIQNSMDSAGCTRIDFVVSRNDTNTILTCQDNGAGMSRDILENVFLVMGESGKSDSVSSVGGMGKARCLICWAQESYKIISHNYILRGCGASYEIENAPFFRGCKFEIEIKGNDVAWVSVIKDILSKCNLKQSVFINGELFRGNLRVGRLVRQLSFGDVYVNKSAEQKFLVRVGGCWMFDKYVSGVKAQIIVELHQEKSRESMTANRDGLQYKLDNELQSFLNEIAADSRSSLKDKTRHFKRQVNKNKSFQVVSKKKGKEGENGIAVCDRVNTNNESYIFNRPFNSSKNPIDSQDLKIGIMDDPIIESMMILNESDNPKRVQLINNFYHPEKWTTRAGTRYQLLREWFAVCKIVMDELANMSDNSFEFAVGWVFTDNEEGEGADAMHTKEGNVNYLLINPIDEDNKLRYGVNNKDDHYNLIVLACHEASHSIERMHNENFSTLFTHLTARVLRRRNEILTAIKEVKE